jgi:putative transferase (TIGR04331 family)
MKLLTFERNNSKLNKLKVVADWCLQDPDKIDNLTLKKYENRLLNSYHWNNYEKLKRDRKIIDKYVIKIFIELKKNLNKHHNLNNPDYYWSTIILPWLYELIANLFDKWEIVRLIKNKKKIEILVKKFKEDNFYYNKSDEFDIHNKDLNDYIFSKVVDFKFKSKFKKIKYFPHHKKNHKRKNSNKDFLKYLIFNTISKISKNKIFFHGLNFNNSVIKTVGLNLKNLQLPIFYYEKNYHTDNYNKKIRKIILKKSKKKDFMQFCREEISILLPKSFLEDFNKINQAIDSSYFSKFTRKIFTSLKYRKNDFFQIWCAAQRLKGSKYFIFQHGAGYGYDFTLDESYINRISDKFLTWGWNNKNKKYQKFFCIKLSDNFKHAPTSFSKILICLHSNHRYSFSPIAKFKNNLDRLKNLHNFKNLSQDIKGYNLTFRYLSNLNKDYETTPYEKFFKKNVSFDYGKIKFIKILNNYNLVIHDSLETVFLETIAYNVPTVVLVKDFKKLIINNFQNDFKQLKYIGVIHDNYHSVQKMLNNENFNIKDWWFNKKNQLILNKFRKKFIRKPNNLYNDIGKLVN